MIADAAIKTSHGNTHSAWRRIEAERSMELQQLETEKYCKVPRKDSISVDLLEEYLCDTKRNTIFEVIRFNKSKLQLNWDLKKIEGRLGSSNVHSVQSISWGVCEDTHDETVKLISLEASQKLEMSTKRSSESLERRLEADTHIISSNERADEHDGLQKPRELGG